MKQYILRDPEIARRMIDFIRSTAGAANAAGRPLVVEISEYAQKRSNEQNRLYWSLLTEIAEQAVIDGKRFSREAWHEAMKDQFAPKQEGPNGLVAISTTQMTKPQFTEYVQKIESHAAQTFCVEFSATL
jgi:hypothetical protein